MERQLLTQILKTFNYAGSTITSLLNGTRRPSYEVMCELSVKHKVPFNAWLDIKSYLNSTKPQSPPQEQEN